MPAQTSEAAWQHTLGTRGAPCYHCTARERPRAAQGPANKPSPPYQLPSPTAHSTHIAVPAGAAALRHTLDLPGQGLVHKVWQGLFLEQAGPELDGERICSRSENGGEVDEQQKSCSCMHITTDDTLLTVVKLSLSSRHHVDGQFSRAVLTVLVPQCTASMGFTAHQNACCPLLLLPPDIMLAIRDDYRDTSSRSGRKDTEAADCAAELLNDKN